MRCKIVSYTIHYAKLLIKTHDVCHTLSSKRKHQNKLQLANKSSINRRNYLLKKIWFVISIQGKKLMKEKKADNPTNSYLKELPFI